MMELDVITNSDALTWLQTLPSESVNCIVTSPPYYAKRDYGVDGQLGLEKTPEQFIDNLSRVFGEAYRVLRDDGVMWINIDSSRASAKSRYSSRGQTIRSQSIRGDYGEPMDGKKPDLRGTGWRDGELIHIPYMLAMALRCYGWIWRADVIWHKTSAMPESVKDRPTAAHEHLLMFVKGKGYYYDADSIATPVKETSIKRAGRAVSNKHKHASGAPGQTPHSMHQPRPNSTRAKFDESYTDRPPLARPRDVLSISPTKESNVHFATFPKRLASWMILSSCPPGGLVMDMFAGAGTTAIAARNLGRHAIGCELNPKFAAHANARLDEPYTLPMFA